MWGRGVVSLLVALAVACSAHRVSELDPAAQQALDGGALELRGDDGQVLGTLRSHADPPRLVLIQPDGTVVPCGACQDQVRQEALGGGGRTARVLQRFCGVTVDLATRVHLHGGDEEPVVAVFAGAQRVLIEWTAPETLVIHHAPAPADDVYLRRRAVAGVRIEYADDLEPSGQRGESARLDAGILDLASFDFGASGRRQGMPAELLLRVAGWSQQASGLHRPEWGVWTGPAPHGDGPRGAAQVARGIAAAQGRP